MNMRSLRGALCAITVGALMMIALPGAATAVTGPDGYDDQATLETPAESGAEGTEDESSEPSAPVEEAPNPNGSDAEPGETEAPETVTLEGTLIVVPTEYAPVVAESDEDLHEAEVSHTGSVSIATEDNAIIPLFEGDAHDYAAGQEVTATFAVPEEVQAEVEQRLVVEERAVHPLDSAEIAALVVETAAELDEDLDPISHEIGAPIAGAAVARSHQVDVIYLERPGRVRPTQQQITDAVGRVSSYWGTETGGQITGVTVGSIRIEDMPSQYCGAGSGVWPWAASRFGKTMTDYFAAEPRHLIVLESAVACNTVAGAGLGTVGSNVHTGGLIWATVNTDAPNSWNGVVFHEFGHNLSLGHSNTLDCSTTPYDTPWFDLSGVPSSGSCQVTEYMDRIDVMGGGYTFRKSDGSVVSNDSNVAALNATHRLTLGTLPEASIQRLTVSSGFKQTVDLKPSTNSSGVRVIEVTVPGTQQNGGTAQKYLLEYRAGQDRDAQSLYGQWQSVMKTVDLGPGVRVLRAPVPGVSAVLFRPLLSAEAASTNKAKLPYLSGGALFTASGNAFTVRVISLSASNAKVEIGVAGASAPADPPTTPPTTPPVTPPTTPPVSPPTPTSGVRVAGPDRFATAVAVSKHAHPGTTGGTVIVATGLDYPDSLSAAPLGAKLDAPLLLSMPDSLPAVTKAEIQRLKPAQIVVVGGTGAVSSGVEQQLRALSANVHRISGKDRYATSAAIARWGWTSGSTSAFIATGDGFADALSAGAAAGSIGAPVVLVPGSSSSSPVAKALLNDFGVQQLYVAGGASAVSKGMESSLKGSRAVTRFAGSDRFSTSAEIGKRFSTTGGSVYMANGLGFADALTGAAAAGAADAPLMLSMPTCVPGAIKTVQTQVQPSTSYLLGGSGVLSEAVRLGEVC
jgi:putative cell wall-binding protein